MALTIILGVPISKELFNFFSIANGSIISKLHILFSYWGMLFLAMHIGLHIKTIFAKLICKVKKNNFLKMEELKLEQEWDKVFPKNENVNHKKVTFINHFGITLVADMYEPKEYEGKLPAIAVSGPFGAVKEQSSGLYAQEMAERGFLAIAFDPSFTGESGGKPRYMNSPDINVEDFQSAVDFLSNLENVDSEKISIIGICGWGGMALQTACIDTNS